MKDNGGNPYKGENKPSVSSACTKVQDTSKSCAKIAPFRCSPIANPHKLILVKAIIDDQSRRSLATPLLFHYFKDDGIDIPCVLHPNTFSTSFMPTQIRIKLDCEFYNILN